MSVVVSNKDEIIMQLVHYFVTEEDYEPILVNGVKNEVWLENLDAPYKVIRIILIIYIMKNNISLMYLR